MERVDFSEWFYYDESSPSFIRWKVDRVSGRYKNFTHVRKGDVAGTFNNSGYYQVKLNSKLYQCSRVVMELHGVSLSSKDFVDHVDGNRINNSIENLRVVSYHLNARNIKLRKDNSTGVTGVVRMTNGKGQFYYSANWCSLDGKSFNRRFSIAKLGEEEAFRQACEFRTKMIEELNNQGAGYTETHGKRKGVS